MTNPVERRHNVPWTNHHKTVNANLAQHITLNNDPNSGNGSGTAMRNSAARIQAIIAEAVAAGVRLRACGSRWSFSDISVADGGWLLETDRLGFYFFPERRHIDAASPYNPEDLILAQCGAKISAINMAIENPPPGRPPRALRTMGASNGQTIAGSIGTGIHGSAIDVGGLESQVVGLQILTKDKNWWVERESRPVINNDFAARLGATIKRNDALFAAVLVNLGAMGVVHSVMLETTGRYTLASSMQHIPYSSAMATMNSLDFNSLPLATPLGRPYFFQTIVHPARMDIAYCTIRYKCGFLAGKTLDYSQKPGYEPGTEVPLLVSKATQLLPNITDYVTNLLMRLADELRVRSDIPSEWKTPGECYTYTKAREGIASSGFAIPIRQTTEALRIAQEQYRLHPGAPVVFTCRYAQKSPGLLSFIRYDPTCIFDIDGVDTPATQDLIAAVADALEANGIPFTQHWGKTNALTADRLKTAFGSNIDRWNEQRNALLSDAELDCFTSDFINSVGLNVKIA